MSWTTKIVVAHEAGHWVAAHVTGARNAGIELSWREPEPGHLLLRRNQFLSARTRTLIAFGGYAGEMLGLGADQAHLGRASVDVALLEGESAAFDDPAAAACALLRRHSALFDAVVAYLGEVADETKLLTVSDTELRQIAARFGVPFGVEAVDPTFDEGLRWLRRACSAFQAKQLAARDVAVVATNPSDLSAVITASSRERPNSSAVLDDWAYFEQAIAESGFTIVSTSDNGAADVLDRSIYLSFLAADPLDQA